MCFLLAVLMLSVAMPMYAVPSSLRFPHSNRAGTGIVIRDLATGQDLVSENADKFMTPASILKCVTAAAVMLNGGADSRFETSMFVNGEDDGNGVLHGDIIVRGMGDPTLDSGNFPSFCGFADSIATSLSRVGINRIEGRILVDTLGLCEQGPGRGWEYSDLGYSYGAGLYALNFRDNATGGDRAMKNPTSAFMSSLRVAFNRCGIVVESDSLSSLFASPDMDYGSAWTLCSHISPRYLEILDVMMEKSNNLYAEGMLRTLAPGDSIDDALDKEVELLARLGIDLTCLNANDGSGLSRQNSVTPGFMADMLERMARCDIADDYVSIFPKVGVEGTVKNFMNKTRLEGKLVLKSGSMNGVQTYAGYKLGVNGKPTHVVVLMVNSFICGRLAVRKAMSDFLLRWFPE